MLRDLSPAATYISYNNCTPVDLEALTRQRDLLNEHLRDLLDWYTERNRRSIRRSIRVCATKQNPKTLFTYQEGMRNAMSEIFRVLKPQYWATTIFQNSDVKAWTLVHQAATEAGFHIRGVSILDKGQYSPKQLKGITGKSQRSTSPSTCTNQNQELCPT